MQKEESLQIAISRYIKLKYPKAIFTAESSGIRLTIGQAKKAKAMRSGRGLPDLIIFEPKGGYHGLLLELKKEGTRVYLKDGSISSDKHIQEQKEILDRLSEKGYKAKFAVGIDEAIEVIDGYMKM